MIFKRDVACLIGALALSSVAFGQDTAGLSPAPAPSPSEAVPVPPETPSGTPSSAASNSLAASTQLQEVVVTANKRNESVRKVAGSVTALTGKQLEDMGAQNFGDYLNTVPGVQFDQTTPNQSLISMRGITTATTPQENQSPVGIFFEDISMTDPVDVVLVPDFDTFDMARVEVLKGPQGALYGSDALGGAINFVPNHTDLSGFDTRIEAEANWDKDGRVGEYEKGMLNIPIVRDVAGMRLVAYGIYSPGFIDNEATGIHDANDHEVSGGRAIADWKIGSRTTLSVTGLVERTHLGDQDISAQGLGPYKTNNVIPDATTGKMNVDDLRLETDFGFAKLVGIAGYQFKHYQALYDLVSSTLGQEGISPTEGVAIGQLINGLPVGTLAENFNDDLHGYSGELRLVSRSSQHFEWIAGASYSDRRERYSGGYVLTSLSPTIDADLQALAPLLGATTVNELLNDTAVVTLGDQVKAVELAGFADLTYKFNSHWKVQAGGREYRNVVPSTSNTSGIVGLASYGSFSNPVVSEEKDTGFNPRASLSWTPNSDDLFYFLYSHGFSLGGNNLLPPEAGVTFPRSYGSNKLLNFELGAKTAWFGRRLYVDVTPYYVYWKNIPLSITGMGVPVAPIYLQNVGDAHSYGVEMALTAKPLRRLTITNTATWSHAILANDFNPGNSEPVVPYGTPLPGTPHWQFSNMFTYVIPMGDSTLHASALNRFIGPSLPSIQAPADRIGNYDLLGVRAGLTYKGFGTEVFIDNVFNRTAITAENYVANNQSLQYFTHPRVIGIMLTWSPE